MRTDGCKRASSIIMRNGVSSLYATYVLCERTPNAWYRADMIEDERTLNKGEKGKKKYLLSDINRQYHKQCLLLVIIAVVHARPSPSRGKAPVKVVFFVAKAL